jgi:hypothetical protein
MFTSLISEIRQILLPHILHVKNKENYRHCWELIVMVTALGEIRNDQFALSNNPILIVQFKA